MIVLDATLLYALLDRRDRRHGEATAWYAEATDPMTTTPLVLAEVDYFAIRLGRGAAHALYHDLQQRPYDVEWWSSAAAEAADIATRYVDLDLGLTDSSLVALAARHETTEIATFDERHFRAVRPLTGEPAFTLLPLDAALA